ncbi:hypothetical protein HMPREF0731_1902 [Pseudoroseomonas cervicalis ATCC 49957]|uniref:Uncharacterized protein n=1 Tax=Pseudoroseomonas cervicalis ATCC 49957 TaxID=525371 RepID=D5RLE1_9PROT|nr:hypothetical protein HMPREF0731_1902 [Pseudoroseomonas cervicalis ATCC 49957]
MTKLPVILVARRAGCDGWRALPSRTGRFPGRPACSRNRA